LTTLRRHQSASNVPDPTIRDSFRRSRRSSAVAFLHKPRSPSLSHESANPQPRRGLGRVFQSDSDWKVFHRPNKLVTKLKRHQSASNVPDPIIGDSFRRRRRSSAIELLHRQRSQSVSCRSAFDAQAIASNMRLWGLDSETRNTKLSNKRAKHRSKPLPAESTETFYPSSFVCTIATTTMIKCYLLGLWISLYMCLRPVVLVLTRFLAACLSSDPPWAAPSPVSGRAEQRRPSTEASDTCQWAFEALTLEYEFKL